MTEKFVVTFDDALDVPQAVFDQMFAQFISLVPRPKVVFDPWHDLMRRELSGARSHMTILDDPYADVDWVEVFKQRPSLPMVYDRELRDAVDGITGRNDVAELTMTSNVEPIKIAMGWEQVLPR